LEHKEVWQSFVVIASILLMFTFYVLGIEVPAYEFVIQVCCGLLICYLLWRVETLSDLTIEPSPVQPIEALSSERKDAPIATSSGAGGDSLDIGALLQEHCIDTQLYLQHDLSLSQLAQHIGTNRTYLTQYFSRQGITYNTYINDLRIDHFVSLYREAAVSRRTFTAQQLAHDSGYQSYSTFSLAFKQRMGQTVTAWMREMGGGSS
jgi:AraC-like DNA-binding protein